MKARLGGQPPLFRTSKATCRGHLLIETIHHSLEAEHDRGA